MLLLLPADYAPIRARAPATSSFGTAIENASVVRIIRPVSIRVIVVLSFELPI